MVGLISSNNDDNISYQINSLHPAYLKLRNIFPHKRCRERKPESVIDISPVLPSSNIRFCLQRNIQFDVGFP